MSPGYGVRIGAVLVSFLAALGVATSVSAQLYEDTRRSLDLSPDPIARSPRLLGMGRLNYVFDDRRNRITLWDFAGNPTGVLEDDSTSTFELQPTTAATSSLHDLPGDGRSQERQDLAAREVRLGYEAWHRASNAIAYGAIGETGLLRLDRPYSDDVERRTHFTVPAVVPVINGRMPYIFTDRMQYGLRLLYAYQASNDRYRGISKNGAGEYLDKAGQLGPPPDIFIPGEYSVRTLGGGGAISFRFGAPLTLAVGLDETGHLIKGQNEGGRYDSETRENRPYGSGQVTAIGRLGANLEWGADAHGWKSSSKSKWLFTLSTGPAAPPLAGRGSLLRREEEGSTLRTRLRWIVGNFELGGGLSTSYRRTKIFPPDLTDSTSFNAFRNRVFFTVAGDTLALPDSVASDALEERAWEAGGGIGWRVPGSRILVGAEFHRGQDQVDGSLNGAGPKRVEWNVRAGLEWGVNSALRLRAGYLHGWDDRDDFTRRNEYVSNGVTLGVGFTPVGARWSVESGYSAEWVQADFGDPGKPRASRHQLALRVLWPL